VELLEILARSIPYTHDADIDWQLSPAYQNHLLLGLLGNSTFLRQENSCRKNYDDDDDYDIENGAVAALFSDPCETGLPP